MHNPKFTALRAEKAEFLFFVSYALLAAAGCYGGSDHLVWLWWAIGILNVILVLWYGKAWILSGHFRDPVYREYKAEIHKESVGNVHKHVKQFACLPFRKSNPYAEMGAIGKLDNVHANGRTTVRRRGAKQHGAKSSGKSRKSDDGDGGSEPPEPLRYYSNQTLLQESCLQRSLHQHPQVPHPLQLYTFKEFAILAGCAAKTIQNKVSSGAIPRPIQTLFGPRFTLQQVQALLSDIGSGPAVAKRPRGRPRIANSLSKGAKR